MLLNLYGDEGLMFRMLATGFKEAHLEDRVKFEAIEAAKAGAKFKNAVKEKYNAKYLDDADMIIRFALAKEEPVQQDAEKQQAPDEGGEQASDNGGEENVSEAETTASGTDLKKKVVDTVARCLYQEDKNKVDISDLDDFLDGYDVCFIKVSFKEKEGTETQA